MSKNNTSKIENILDSYLKVLEDSEIKINKNLKLGSHVNFNQYYLQKKVKGILENKEKTKEKATSILKIFNSGQNEEILKSYQNKIDDFNIKEKYIYSISNKNRLSVFIKGLNNENIEKKLADFYDKLIQAIDEINKEIDKEIDNKTGLDIFFDKIFNKRITKIDESIVNNQITRAIYAYFHSTWSLFLN